MPYKLGGGVYQALDATLNDLQTHLFQFSFSLNRTNYFLGVWLKRRYKHECMHSYTYDLPNVPLFPKEQTKAWGAQEVPYQERFSSLHRDFPS